MTKQTIPIETLIVLQNQLDSLPARSPQRRVILEETATLYDLSVSTVRRLLRQYHQPHAVCRNDYNQPRVTTRAAMQQYCEIVAALMLRTTNKKGRHLSTLECIRLLEEHGVETPDGQVKTPVGLLKRSTVSRYLNRWGYNTRSMTVEPAVVPFQAEYSNDCWQFDFSPSDLKKLPEDTPNHTGKKQPTLMLASVVDDRSGVCYQEYHNVYGEDTLTALRFLFNAMAPKNYKNFPFQGIPNLIYLDNGPFAKSNLFKRVLKTHLNIEVRPHMPANSDGRRKTARSKGKVERSFKTVKDALETLYNFHKPQSLEEANLWLRKYLERHNDKQHRSENHSRLEDWLKNLPPEGFRQMCSWKRFCTFAREPEQRKVDSEGCVSVNGTRYQVDYNMAGQEVTLLWGVFDNELYVEFNNEKSGPFYPAKGPIPLGTYRKPKKSETEKRADHIGELAKQISIPRSALSGQNRTVQALLHHAKVTKIDTPRSIPFENKDPFQQPAFKNRVEAKTAIAEHIGRPLARLKPEQLLEIDSILNETLDKKTVLAQVRTYFTISVKNRRGEGSCTGK